jgi:hypothetical protein
MRRIIVNLVFGSAFVFACAVSAAAQPAPTPPPAIGQMVVEQIQSGWLFAPDVRVTDLDGKTGALAGGYLGHMTDRSWLIGAGGYVLTNREDDFTLWYAGPVFEWLIRADRRIGFGIRTVVGIGGSTLAKPLSDFVDPRALASAGNHRRPSRSDLRLIDAEAMVAVHDDFFVAEPQLNVMWNLSAGRRLVFGLGYRAVGNAPLLGDDINGLSGSVSFQIGGK